MISKICLNFGLSLRFTSCKQVYHIVNNSTIWRINYFTYNENSLLGKQV